MDGGYGSRAAVDDGSAARAAPMTARSSSSATRTARRDDRSGQDPDLWIAQLYDDLCDHIRAAGRLAAGREAPGSWTGNCGRGTSGRERLSNALATCRVFVPLYSQRYFKSEHCGKEWFAFNRRALNHAARTKPAAVETIVPALWIPMRDGHAPRGGALGAVQAGDFGPLYAEHGFYGIMKVSRWRDAYEEAVYLLARRIVDAAEASPVEPGQALHYESLPVRLRRRWRGPGRATSRCGSPSSRRSRDELPDGRDRVLLRAGTSATGTPTGQDSVRSLADHAADLARSLSYTPDVGDLYQHEAELLGGEPPSGPEVLLIDPWAVDAAGVPRHAPAARPDGQALGPGRRRVEPAGRRRCRRSAERSGRRSTPALPRKLREGRATSALAVRGVPSLEDFGMVLPTVIAAAGRHYLRIRVGPPAQTQRGRE